MQEISEVLGKCILLTWARPCQEPQCLRPTGVAKLSLDDTQKIAKPLGPTVIIDGVHRKYLPQLSSLTP